METKKKGVNELYETKELAYYFEKFGIIKKLSRSMGEKVDVDLANAVCLKSTRRMSVYKLFVQKQAGDYPIILKIYDAANTRSDIEINIYESAHWVLQEFLPEIYLIEKKGEETWVFMEFTQQVRGQITFTPAHFDYIIPTLAKLHARTYESNIMKYKGAWGPWLPVYESNKMRNERIKYIGRTIDFLDDAMGEEHLNSVVKPYHKSLMNLFDKGPDFFPELLANGSAVTHGDLHLQNICSNNIKTGSSWNIQFIDWESAKYAPVWFDMIVLVEILIAFRKDWQSRGEEIRTHCARLYAKEMEKHGIRFKTDPVVLYKMAYVQRTLEKGLHTQLRRIFDYRGGELLPYHLEKVTTWGKELGLLK